MRKLITSLLLFAGLAVTFSSCQSREEQVHVGPNPLEAPQKIAFSFQAPKGLPTTYAFTRPYHDAAEWGIKDNKLYLYEFMVPESATLPLTNPDGYIFLKRHQITVTGSGPSYQAELNVSELSPAGGDARRFFYFVANVAASVGSDLEAGVDTFSKLKSRMLASVQGANASSHGVTFSPVVDANGNVGAYYLPFTGIAVSENGGTTTWGITPGTTDRITVDLVRAVARIDIRTTLAKIAGSTEPNNEDLIITKATLNNTRAKSSVYANNPLEYGVVSGVTPFTKIPAGGINPNSVPAAQTHGLKGRLNKAFYLYENDNNNQEIVSVDIEYQYGATTSTLTVPFTDVAGNKLPIERNYIYVIVLGDGDPNINEGDQTIQGSIVVDSWDDEVIIPTPFQPVAVTANTAVAPNSFDRLSRTLTVATAGVTTPITLTFASNFADTQDTFTATILANANGVIPTWVKTSWNGAVLSVDSVEANTTGQPRSVKIAVVDALHPTNYKYLLTITQL